MLRILHLVHNTLDEAWLMDKGTGPDWCWDEDEVLVALAKPHTDMAEIKVLYRADLKTIDEYASFDLLWEDSGTPKEFRDAFDACFAFGDSVK